MKSLIESLKLVEQFIELSESEVSSIRELQKLKSAALEEYHKKIREIDERINVIRTKRKTVLKKSDFKDYYEYGRDAKPSKGPGYYPGE